jgi:hypothetical protein
VDRLARGGMLIAGGGYAGSIEIGYEQLVLALESVSRAAGAEARRGDCAAVPNLATSGRPDPPTSQHALRQARRLARNLAGEPKPYRNRMLGQAATLAGTRGSGTSSGHPHSDSRTKEPDRTSRRSRCSATRAATRSTPACVTALERVLACERTGDLAVAV